MLTQLVFVSTPFGVSVEALVFGPSLGAFFGSGFCIQRCHQQLMLPLESAPFPPSGNVGKHLVWPGGPAKKDAIPARAPSTNSFINFVWEGREWTNKRKHERWMAPFNAETGNAPFSRKMETRIRPDPRKCPNTKLLIFALKHIENLCFTMWLRLEF